MQKVSGTNIPARALRLISGIELGEGCSSSGLKTRSGGVHFLVGNKQKKMGLASVIESSFLIIVIAEAFVPVHRQFLWRQSLESNFGGCRKGDATRNWGSQRHWCRGDKSWTTTMIAKFGYDNSLSEGRWLEGQYLMAQFWCKAGNGATHQECWSKAHNAISQVFEFREVFIDGASLLHF